MYKDENEQFWLFSFLFILSNRNTKIQGNLIQQVYRNLVMSKPRASWYFTYGLQGRGIIRNCWSAVQSAFF